MIKKIITNTILVCFSIYPLYGNASMSDGLLKNEINKMEEKSNLTPELLSVSLVCDKYGHSAFTDLIEYQGELFLSFREADNHAGGKSGKISIYRSVDKNSFDEVSHFGKDGYDLRDPHFSITPDGRLMLTLAGAIYKNGKHIGCVPLVSFSTNGCSWSELETVNLKDEWIWRVTWHKGVGYGASYRITDPTDDKKPWILTLFKTVDGLNYEEVTKLHVPDNPNETTLRFLKDDTMVALVRRNGNGFIGKSKFPYKEWQWNDIGHRFGGQDFIVLDDETMLVGSRIYPKKGKKLQTAICKLTKNSYEPKLILPSGKDTGYPGMVYRDGILYVSYYSSHEKKSSIYLAKIKL